jgi:hypothetical protein
VNAQPQPLSQFPSLDAWGQEFMRAAEAHPRSRRPLASWINRRITFLLAIVVAVPAGGALAAASGLVDLPNRARTINPPPFEVVDDGGPAFELPKPGDVVGYVDLDTGLPILCPDGSPLRQIVKPNGTMGGSPKCDDGTVPEKYTEQEQVWEEYINTGGPDLAVNGPNFQVIVKYGPGGPGLPEP